MMARKLGANGPLVSSVGLGGNNFGRPGSVTEDIHGTKAVFAAALDVGVTLLDTAEMYGTVPGGSESMIGEAVEGRRSEFLLATKFGHAAFPMPSLEGVATGRREYLRAAIDESLGRLRTDWIDLYQQHTPDPSTPIEETAGALEELVAEGKIRFYGFSNFSGEQMRAAAAAGNWVSAQDEYSLIRRGAELELLPVARDLGFGFLPYYPLYNGLLTGKFTRDARPGDTRLSRQRPELLDEAPWDAIDAFAVFCADRGITMLEATFGWMLAQAPVASVIAGATRPEQVRANAAAAEWIPTADDVIAISRIFASSASGD